MKNQITAIIEELNNAIQDYKTVLKNDSFEQMTPEEKRIEIARDVINGIFTRRFLVRDNRYWSVDQICGMVTKDSLKGVTCECCAAGAAA